MASYYTILTNVGQAKVANAVALGQKVNLSTLAVGDANGVTPQPDANAKSLVHERRRAPLNRVEIDKDNPNFIVCEQVLPPEVGGWEIREIGVFDDEGNLIAYGNYPPTYKPLMNEGTSRTQTVRLVMQVSDTASVTLKVDPSVVLATRQYVDDAKKENATALKTVKDGLGAAAVMRHSQARLIELAGSKDEVADTAQLVELRKTVDSVLGGLGEAAKMSVSGANINDLAGKKDEVASTAQLIELRDKLKGESGSRFIRIPCNTNGGLEYLVIQTGWVGIQYLEQRNYSGSVILPRAFTKSFDTVQITGGDIANAFWTLSAEIINNGSFNYAYYNNNDYLAANGGNGFSWLAIGRDYA